MLAWIFVLVVIVAEVLALRWWLSKEYYPFFFNAWAALLYTAVLAVDLVLGWALAQYGFGDSAGLDVMAFLGLGLLVVTILLTFFFRWVVRQDLTDPELPDTSKK